MQKTHLRLLFLLLLGGLSALGCRRGPGPDEVPVPGADRFDVAGGRALLGAEGIGHYPDGWTIELGTAPRVFAAGIAVPTVMSGFVQTTAVIVDGATSVKDSEALVGSYEGAAWLSLKRERLEKGRRVDITLYATEDNARVAIELRGVEVGGVMPKKAPPPEPVNKGTPVKWPF